MNIFWIILLVLAVYFFVVFFVSRLFVPFMGFKKYLPPTVLPEDIKQNVISLEQKSNSQQEYLQAVYDLVLNKTLHQWHHTRFSAAIRLPRAFVSDLEEIWRTQDFIYCTGINYVIFVMLISSKFFKADDIKVKHVFVNFFIHQYLQVNVGGKWIDVDPAGTGIRGEPLGNHLSWFG